jgi:hypothetical protein
MNLRSTSVIRTRNSLRNAVFAVILSLSFAASARPARGADPSQAQREVASEHYKRGITFFHDKNYTAALAEFRRAYEIVPNPQVLYNLGQIQMALHDAAAALQSYQRYLSEAGDSVPSDRRVEVQSAIASLKERVAQIDVRTNVSDGDVAVDDDVVAHVPLKSPILVTAGRRHVTLIRAGQQIAARWVELAAGDHPVVQLDAPVTQTPASPAPLAIATPATPPPQPPVPLWLAWGTVGVLAAGTTVTGLLAVGASSALSRDRNTVGVSRSTLDKDQSQTKTLALVTDILGGLTILAAGASTYLTLWGTPRDERSSGAALTVLPTGATVSGRF